MLLSNLIVVLFLLLWADSEKSIFVTGFTCIPNVKLRDSGLCFVSLNTCIVYSLEYFEL